MRPVRHGHGFFALLDMRREERDELRVCGLCVVSELVATRDNLLVTLFHRDIRHGEHDEAGGAVFVEEVDVRAPSTGVEGDGFKMNLHTHASTAFRREPHCDGVPRLGGGIANCDRHPLVFHLDRRGRHRARGSFQSVERIARLLKGIDELWQVSSLNERSLMVEHAHAQQLLLAHLRKSEHSDQCMRYRPDRPCPCELEGDCCTSGGLRTSRLEAAAVHDHHWHCLLFIGALRARALLPWAGGGVR
mmetsp:Transcript_5206/g.10990  ORF Transcript_5206/g.10990 Transcript_5206/m.10990 type:complete len:247 (-) Transcript_5206:769-1509(-)